MAAEFRQNHPAAAARSPLVEICIRKVSMKTFLRKMSDRQTTVLTLGHLESRRERCPPEKGAAVFFAPVDRLKRKN
jgi:hypothetical protein